MLRILPLLFALLILPAALLGGIRGIQTTNGMLHVHPAAVLQQGELGFRTNMGFYTKAVDFLGQSSLPGSAVDYWNVTGDFLMSYGFSGHFDATAMLRMYQDTHRANEHNIPDDLFLGVKAGSFRLGSDNSMGGLMLHARIPTGETHNYPYVPYASGAFEVGIMGMFSYYADAYFPDRGINLHLNLGFYLHNDNGRVLHELPGTPPMEVKSSVSATQFQYAVGFIFPTEMFNLNLEFWGAAFTSRPDTAVFSRENYVYFTPSVTFKPQPRIKFDLGADIRVSSDENTTRLPAGVGDPSSTIPNYDSWKAWIGLNFVLREAAMRPEKGVDVKKRADFYETMVKERSRAKSIEEELRRLRREREQAEKELEELRQLLEEEDRK
jgi:hypothetical protein